MSSKPWMPLYVGDFLADTAHLETIEIGAYLLLICHYWRTGPLPADEARLRNICRLSRHNFSKSKGVILKFFVLENEKYLHKRIDREIAKAVEISNKRAEAGRAGGVANAQASAKQLPTQSQSQLHIKKKTKAKKDFLDDLELPDFVNKETWAEFVQMRKEIKKKLTPTACKQIFRDMTKWHGDGINANDCLVNSIRGNWQGVFPPTKQKNEPTSKSSVDFVADNDLESWAKRNGAPGPKQQIGYDYNKYRADLTTWEKSR